MKRIRINQGLVGLVYKNGDYQRILKQGVYWLGFSELLVKFHMSEQFEPGIELNALLNDKELSAMLEVIDLNDQEVAVLYQNANYLKVLGPGQHAFWRGSNLFTYTKVDLSKYRITEEIPLMVQMLPALANKQRVFPIESFEKGLLYVDGNFIEELQPGIHRFWKTPEVVQVFKTDTRSKQLEINGQEILTRDKAGLRVNFQVQYKVVDIRKVLLENKEFESQLYVMVQLALRDIICKLTFDELLERKQAATAEVLETVVEKASKLGLEVIDCGIKDIVLPGEMKEIMNQVLMAQKKAQANSITRREETASTRSLLNTAKLMEDNQMLFKLKEMEYVEKIAEKIDSITVGGGSQVIDQLKAIFTK